MVATSIVSLIMANTVGYWLNDLTNKYIQSYDHLARTNAPPLDRVLALGRMVISKMQTPPDDAGYAERLQAFQNIGPETDREAQAARKLIVSIIDDVNPPSDNVALARIDDRI